MHTFLKQCAKYEPEMPDIVYHYCSVDSMLKILQNNCLWMSDADKTNDKTESRYFCKQMETMLLDIIDLYQGKFESTILTAVKGVLKKTIESLYLDSAYIVRNTKDYLCCFSESDDLLSQWRAYGSDGQGVAIGFNAKLLAEIEDSYQYDFIKVIYGQNDISENI